MAIRTEDHSDLKKFGNRLWYVMTGKGYTTPRALATSLYDQQLVSVKSKPGKYTRKEDIRKNAISSVEKKIVRHLHADAADDVQGEFLLAYCRHLDCSSDYLLGLTNVTSGDIEVRRICEKTGLSEKAIVHLIKYTDGIHEYSEHCPINYKGYSHNVGSRATTNGKELKIISEAMQDLIEKQF